MRGSSSLCKSPRRFAAALAMVLLTATQSQAQTLFGAIAEKTPGSSQPFRVTFVNEAPNEPVATTAGQLKTSAALRQVPIGIVRPPSTQPAGKRRLSSDRAAKKFAAGLILGVAGFFAGGLVGAGVGTMADEHDDNAGVLGAVIGAPIGAAIGAVIGVRLIK